MKGIWRKGLGALAVLAVLAGCGAPAGQKGQGSQGQQAQPAPRDYYKVGAVTSLSGEDQFGGNLTKRGYEAWAQYVNKQGGIEIKGKKYQVKMYYADDQSTPATGADAIERLIKSEGVDFVLGPYTSGVTLAVAPITEKYKTPHITGSAESPRVWEPKYKYTFGTIPAVTAIGPAMTDFFAKQNPKPASMAIVGLNDAFSKATAESFKAAAEKAGIPVVKFEIVPPNTDFTPIVTAIKAAGAETLAIGSHEKAAMEIVKAAKSLDYNPKAIFQHYGMTSSDFLKGLGKDAEFVFGATYWLPSERLKDPLFGNTENYVKEFKAMFNSEPDYTEAGCTAAGIAFQEALKKIGAAPPLNQEQKDALVQALEQIQLDTFYGKVKFATEGAFYHDNVGLTPLIVQVQGGKVSAVSGPSPEKRAAYPVAAWKSR